MKSPKAVSLWLNFFQSHPPDCGGGRQLVFGVSDFYSRAVLENKEL